MITTSIRPTSQHVHLEFDVPEEYVGQDVEVTVQLKQQDEGKPAPVTMKDFWGIISPETADELQGYVKKSREEWDRDFC